MEVRKLLTEIFMEVTDEELEVISDEVYRKAKTRAMKGIIEWHRLCLIEGLASRLTSVAAFVSKNEFLSLRNTLSSSDMFNGNSELNGFVQKVDPGSRIERTVHELCYCICDTGHVFVDKCFLFFVLVIIKDCSMLIDTLSAVLNSLNSIEFHNEEFGKCYFCIN